jgi:competence protein ComEC
VDVVLIFGLSFVAGGIVAVELWPTLVAAALITWMLRATRRAAPFVVPFGLALGAWRASHAIAVHEAARDVAASAIGPPKRCTALARVEGSPMVAQGAVRWSAWLTHVECEGVLVAWSGPATLYGGPRSLARGDRVEIVAQLATPQRFWNEVTGDPRPSDARRESVESGGVVDARIVERAWGPLALIDRVRAIARDHIDASFSPDTAPMARALVLGESDLDPADDAAFRSSGLSHLLAVSGMHLVLVVIGAAVALRALLARFEWIAARFDVARVAAALGVPIAWGYASFAGGSGSALRAAWMLTAAFAARALGRRGAASRAFALSLVAMAIADPLVVHDVSFVLSAAATGGLLFASEPIRAAIAARLPPWVLGGDWLARSLGATLAATFACAPVLARFAPTLPLAGAIANLVAVPLGEALALPLCLVHAFLAPWPAAESGCALVASGALAAVRYVARVSVRVPWLALPVPMPTSWQLATLAVATMGLARFRARGVVVATAVAALILLELRVRADGAPHGRLRVTFLDVGQGDSALVDLPDGGAMLIDGGGIVGSPVDIGTRVVAPVLRGRRRDSIAIVALSHPHPDHFSGLPTGLVATRFTELWDTGQGEHESVGGRYADLLALARTSGATVVRPDALCGAHDVGGARVDVLAPCPGPDSDRGPNDNSLVLRIAYGARSVLFVGDAEHAEEGDLLRAYGARLRSDLLKVGHHGSRTSSTPAFIEAVSPHDAVISAGVRNHFGHPTRATLDTLGRAGVHIWRTDRDGAVTATTNGTAWDIAPSARR